MAEDVMKKLARDRQVALRFFQNPPTVVAALIEQDREGAAADGC